jgi:4-coumarate--CoA ligase
LRIGTINEFVQAFPSSAKDEEVGEIPVAFVVKKAGTVLSPKDVIARLRCETGSFYKTDMSSMIFEFILLLESINPFFLWQVAPQKKVRKVVFTDKIPRSAT